MATPEEFAAEMERVAGLVQDFSKWLISIGLEARKSQDPRSQRLGSVYPGGAKAAANLGAGLLSVVDIYTNIETNRQIFFGTEVLTFAGSISEEEQTVSVTGQDWFVDFATTPIFPFYQDGARTSDILAYAFVFTLDNPVVGVGWDITMTTPSVGGVDAGDYDVIWFGIS